VWLLTAAACGGPGAGGAAAPRATAGAKLPDGPPLVTPREVMSYRLALAGVDLATYDVAAGDVTNVDGHRVIAVQSHVKTRGIAGMVKNVDDTYTSWIDVETGRPRRWTTDETDGGVHERTDARLDQRAENVISVDVWRGDKTLHETQKVSMAEVWDYNAYLIALRAWDAPKGSTIESEAFRSRYMWHVTMTVHGDDTLVTELGEFPTVRFDGRAYRINRDGTRDTSLSERAFSIWITRDSGRVPVLTRAKTDYGDVELSIVDYQPGSGDRLRR
jgi:hypothetical protein